MSETLLPCPFCGGEAILESNKLRYGTIYSAYCQKCGAEITGFSEHEAVAAWNRRAKPTNADRIRGMSDEELAEFIDEISGFQADYLRYKGTAIINGGLLDWLRQPVEEVHDGPTI